MKPQPLVSFSSREQTVVRHGTRHIESFIVAQQYLEEVSTYWPIRQAAFNTAITTGATAERIMALARHLTCDEIGDHAIPLIGRVLAETFPGILLTYANSQLPADTQAKVDTRAMALICQDRINAALRRHLQNVAVKVPSPADRDGDWFSNDDEKIVLNAVTPAAFGG